MASTRLSRGCESLTARPHMTNKVNKVGQALLASDTSDIMGDIFGYNHGLCSKPMVARPHAHANDPYPNNDPDSLVVKARIGEGIIVRVVLGPNAIEVLASFDRDPIPSQQEQLGPPESNDGSPASEPNTTL